MVLVEWKLWACPEFLYYDFCWFINLIALISHMTFSCGGNISFLLQVGIDLLFQPPEVLIY
jgi:hypothetical protein